ncbi:MAG TPA: hypothetical protein VIU42_07260, partial [Xanthobacteraceae bacterium]
RRLAQDRQEVTGQSHRFLENRAGGTDAAQKADRGRKYKRSKGMDVGSPPPSVRYGRRYAAPHE